jgi:hypothetical protein
MKTLLTAAEAQRLSALQKLVNQYGMSHLTVDEWEDYKSMWRRWRVYGELPPRPFREV